MITVTGDAGFIGTNLYKRPQLRGLATVIVDRLGSRRKWRSLAAPAAALDISS